MGHQSDIVFSIYLTAPSTTASRFSTRTNATQNLPFGQGVYPNMFNNPSGTFSGEVYPLSEEDPYGTGNQLSSYSKTSMGTNSSSSLYPASYYNSNMTSYKNGNQSFYGSSNQSEGYGTSTQLNQSGSSTQLSQSSYTDYEQSYW